MKPLLYGLGVALAVLIGCERSDHRATTTTPLSRPWQARNEAPSFVACVTAGPAEGFSLSVQYPSHRALNDLARLRYDVERVFQAVEPEAARRGIRRITVAPTNSREVSTFFVFRQNSDSSWSTSPLGLGTELRATPGPALSQHELDDMKRAVSQVPDPLQFEGASIAGTCAVSDEGLAVNRVTASYTERLGDGRAGLDEIAKTLQREAERAGVDEAVISVSLQNGSSEAYRARRTAQGWSRAARDGS